MVGYRWSEIKALSSGSLVHKAGQNFSNNSGLPQLYEVIVILIPTTTHHPPRYQREQNAALWYLN